MKPVDHLAPVQTFVQQALGCGCPEEVLQTILTNDFTLPARPSLLIRRLLIGNRLLVYLAAPDGDTRVADLLTTLAVHGQKERQEHGYSRVRVVLLSEQPDRDRIMLEQRFTAIRGDDVRLHLHIVDRREHPAITTGLLDNRA